MTQSTDPRAGTRGRRLPWHRWQRRQKRSSCPGAGRSMVSQTSSGATTKLYDRTADEVTIEDIEKIGI